jgi:hypothetical protein
MRIDPVLCRQILVAIEADPNAGGGQILSISIDGYDEKTIAHHVKYLWETNLISGVEITCMDSPCVPEIGATDITHTGRSFLAQEAKTETALDDHGGIFISHITEEKATAALLKNLMHDTFGSNTHIFVSSDYVSIPGGELWFHAILAGLRNCAVVIVLLSPDSLNRSWINFEAGVGIGANAKVIPTVVHGLEISDVGHPLCNLQIRSLQTGDTARALLNDVAATLEQDMKTVDVDAMVTFAVRPMVGTGWVGVDWARQFLAVEGPVHKLKKVDDQQFVREYAEALRKGGFMSHDMNRSHRGPTISAGYKIVYLTDKKTYYAEITNGDLILTAKPE